MSVSKAEQTTHSLGSSQRHAYGRALRSLLWRTGRPALQSRVEHHLAELDQLVAGEQAPEDAFAEVYRRARQRVVERLVEHLPSPSERGWGRVTDDSSQTASTSHGRAAKTREMFEAYLPEVPSLTGPDFHCDAALGGVARWLRAAGYDAAWWPGIDDDDLLRKVLTGSAIMLTTDRPLVHRAIVARGVVPALLVPITLKRHEQFRYVMDRLELPRLRPRCMSCGGRLQAVAKDAVRRRIPPKTYPWCDDYFLCQRCGKLFWEGTHWTRIRPRLQQAGPG